MNQNIEEKRYENECKTDEEKISMKQKEYRTPNITKIGLIHKSTLGGVINPAEDSGSNFTS